MDYSQTVVLKIKQEICVKIQEESSWETYF